MLARHWATTAGIKCSQHHFNEDAQVGANCGAQGRKQRDQLAVPGTVNQWAPLWKIVVPERGEGEHATYIAEEEAVTQE